MFVLLDIIHGDVKPHNVLVFKADNSSFTTKVADFGFSIRFTQDDNTCIKLARSPLWYAPECDEQPEFTSSQPLKTDVFSFGLLCVWFLFEKCLSGILPLPESAQLEIPSHTYEGEEPALKILNDLKKEGSLK